MIPAPEAKKPQASTRLANGKRNFLLADVDGRSVIGRRYRELSEGLANQLGGNPSPGQQAMIKSAAMLALQNEIDDCAVAQGQEIDSDRYCRRANVLATLLVKSGLNKASSESAKLIDHHSTAILDA